MTGVDEARRHAVSLEHCSIYFAGSVFGKPMIDAAVFLRELMAWRPPPRGRGVGMSRPPAVTDDELTVLGRASGHSARDCRTILHELHRIGYSITPTTPAPDTFRLPAEMTPEIRDVLSLMCFQFVGVAQAYRSAGHKIALKAEDEQSFCMWRYLKAVELHGPDWRDAIRAEILAMHEAAVKSLPPADTEEAAR